MQLELVPNNIDLMFPNASSDPFASNGSGILGSITGVINGIVVPPTTTSDMPSPSGGVAYCELSVAAARAVHHGLGSPIGDVFYIDS